MRTDFVTAEADMSSLVRLVLQSDNASASGRATYLRSLVATIQVELGGKPVLAQVRGRVKHPGKEESLKALEVVNGRFYPLVLAAVDELGHLSPLERNARSGFARSAASVLRTAIRLGLNPMGLVLSKTTKMSLQNWADKHRPAPKPLRLAAGIKRAKDMVQDFSSLLGRMVAADRATVVAQFREALQAAHLEEAPAHGRPRSPARGGRAEVVASH